MSALISALRRLDPTCAINALMLLSNLDDPASQARRIMSVMINDVVDVMEGPFLLILDDLHVITRPEIHAALDRLIEYLPLASGVGIFIGQEWWRTLTIVGATFSVVYLVLYLHPIYWFALALNAEILLALWWAHWPPASMVGS